MQQRGKRDSAYLTRRGQSGVERVERLGLGQREVVTAVVARDEPLRLRGRTCARGVYEIRGQRNSVALSRDGRRQPSGKFGIVHDGTRSLNDRGCKHARKFLEVNGEDRDLETAGGKMGDRARSREQINETTGRVALPKEDRAQLPT